jgi:predicted nucleic acid-binding protein
MTAADLLPPSFVDTNVIVYALAQDDHRRAHLAQELLDDLMRKRALHISTQVLQELFVTLTRKGMQPLSPKEALKSLDALAQFPVFQVDYPAIRSAAELHAKHTLSFWDALIVISAMRSGAKRLYTEDLNHGQKVHGVEIVNPFR